MDASQLAQSLPQSVLDGRDNVAPAPFSAAELNRLAAKAGYGHHIESAVVKGASLLEGQFRLEDGRGGLQLHTFDGRETEDATVSISLPPALGLCVVLAGDLDFSLDGKVFELANTGCNAFAMNLCRPALLQRPLRKGRAITKVNITVDHGWLEAALNPERPADGIILRCIRQHGLLPFFTASSSLQAIAREILAMDLHKSDFKFIALESLMLRFVAEALGILSRELDADLYGAMQHKTIKPGEEFKARKLIRYLEVFVAGDEARAFSLQRAASEMGMSVSSLQRLARRALGQPPLEYLRRRKLCLARDAMLKRGASVGEAAYLAGYNHVSNFTAAFKRAFGVPPGSL